MLADLSQRRLNPHTDSGQSGPLRIAGRSDNWRRTADGIDIIALLISIPLPLLNNARRAARGIKCASNMRQIASALLM